MYKSFIRPSLEYGNTLWDNIDLDLEKKLEKIQKECLRIITGLTRSCSLNKLYSESGIETLASRRNRQKLCMFYKIENGRTPQTLKEKLPLTVQNRNSYSVRSKETYTSINGRAILYYNSYFPSTIRAWNAYQPLGHGMHYHLKLGTPRH